MPSDAVTLAVTTGFGVSVIAGIVSGVCYILAYGFRRNRNRESLNPWKCTVCGGSFRSIDGVLESGRVVTCSRCKERVCKIRCAKRQTVKGSWICQDCQKPDTWFKGILKSIQPNTNEGIFMKTMMNTNRIDEIDEDIEAIRKKEKEEIRDFIERLVSAMLGGDVDDTSINKLYNDKQYDGMFFRYHMDLSNALTDLGSALHMSIANLPVLGSNPCSAHTSLKHLIQKIIREALELPRLNQANDHPAIPSNDSDRTYEDLLATAILNKVIQTYQDDLPPSSSNSISSRLSNSSRTRSRLPKDKEYFFGEETLEKKYRNNGNIADVESASISSLDSSISSAKYGDQMSLTIQQRIEEVSPTDDDTDEEDTEYTESNSLLNKEDSDWQENWYLQKRKFNGTNSPVPVPMLVPNPTTEAKVLIGDREAEDTTDLSDAASDYGDTESVPGIKTLLVESKTVIGGKNLLENINVLAEEQTEREEAVEEDQNVDELSIVDTEMLDKNCSEDQNNEHSSLLSVEQDTEYTEKYASLPRTILKSPVPNPRNSKTMVAEVKSETPTQNGFHVQEPIGENGCKSDASSNEDENNSNLFKGSYSEREKEKWKHAIEMKNNPYSKESLEKRIGNKPSSNSTNSRFGRDYYIKEAAKSTGSRKKLNDDGSNNDGVLVQTNSWIKETQPNTKITYEDVNEEVTPKSEPTSPISPTILNKSIPNYLDISSDSDLSVERVYNLQSGKIIEKIGDQSKEIKMNGLDSPKGIKYESKSTELDENHNNINIKDKKREFLRSLTMSDDDESNPVIKSPENLTFEQKIADERQINKSKNYDNVNQVPFNNFKNEEIRSIEQPEQKLNSKENFQKTNNEINENKNMIVVEKYIDFVRYSEDKKDANLSENETINSSNEFNLEHSTEDLQNRSISSPNSLEADPEITNLKDKQVVKNILGEFSKSYPNLTKIPPHKRGAEKNVNNSTNNLLEINTEAGGDAEERDEEISTPSVKNLKKKFEVKNVNKIQDKQVYSLTARSIPREFRQELKKTEENDEKLQTEPAKYTSLNNIPIEEEKETNFPKAKSRIEYFENLKK